MSVLLKWDNAKAFKQHLEEMRLFRRSHPSESVLRARVYEHMPVLYVQHPIRDSGGTNHAVDEEGWRWLIPLQEAGKWAFLRN